MGTTEPAAPPGVFQQCMGTSTSIWRLWETDAKLHVQYHVDGTLADILPVYIYTRPSQESQFGSETQPNGVTLPVPGDRKSPSICKPFNHDPEQTPRTLPDMVVQWMWCGMSLAELVEKYIKEQPRQADLITSGLFSVRVVMGSAGSCMFACTEDAHEHPLLFDRTLKQWTLPDAVPACPGRALSLPRPVPREAVQWLYAEVRRRNALATSHLQPMPPLNSATSVGSSASSTRPT